jgi:hypothetical protein
MSIESGKFVCRECNSRLRASELLMAAHPFQAGEMVLGCPRCQDIGPFDPICDEHDCWDFTCAGTPTADGYRMTCYRHRPRAEELAAAQSTRP